MSLTRSTAPADSLLTVPELKKHLREDSNAQDTLIGSISKAAEEQLEMFTRRQYMLATYQLKLPAFWGGAVLELPRPPLLAVSSITYTNTSGTAGTVLASSVYTVVTRWRDSDFGAIFLAKDQNWPDLDGAPNADEVVITFTAGYSSGTVAAQRTATPDRAKHIVRSLSGGMFLFAEDFIAGATIAPVPITKDLMYGLQVIVLPEMQEVA